MGCRVWDVGFWSLGVEGVGSAPLPAPVPPPPMEKPFPAPPVINAIPPGAEAGTPEDFGLDHSNKATSGGASQISAGASTHFCWACPVCL